MHFHSEEIKCGHKKNSPFEYLGGSCSVEHTFE